MKFTVVGGGAIGGVFAAHLRRAGHQVTVVDTNREHVEAIRMRGLRVEGHAAFTADVEAVTPSELAPPLGIVLLAVKAHHTREALAPVAPLLGADEYVVSLQNGLEELHIAEAVGAQRTVGAFLTLGAHYEAPGRIIYGGPATVRVGEIDGTHSGRVELLAKALAAVQPVQVTGNIFGYLWAKLALGSFYFATALVDADVLEILDRPRHRSLFEDLVGETVIVAEATGVAVEAFDGFDPRVMRPGRRDPQALSSCWDGQRRYWSGKTQRRTGIWRDLAIRKRKTEAEALLGTILREAERVGVAVPLNRALAGLIAEVEAGRAGLSWSHLDRLAEAR